MNATQFRMLGPLEVDEGGRTLALGGAKQRSVLALLLLDRGRPVPTEGLIEAVWSGAPPETAAKSVQVYVSGLRKVLGEGRIVTRPRGYELRAEPGEVDLDRFDELVRAASDASPEDAARLLRAALGLVRGPPLADLALEPWAVPEVARIEERVLDAVEARVDADLAVGRSRELVTELEQLTSEQPFRERFLEQLMLALYRSGRQADALAAYRRGATRLRDELGLEPSRSLQDLQAGILRHDGTLDVPTPRPSRSGAFAHPRGWKLVTVGAGALLAAAATAFAIVATRDHTASLESLPPGVAIIDADTGSLVSHVSKAEIPEPVEAVAGSGSFWVWNLSPFSLVEISPETGQIARRIGSPFSGDAGWYLPEKESVWFTGPHELVRVDTREGRAVDRFRIIEDDYRIGGAWVTRCAGSLWVASNEEGFLLRVDPETGTVEARIRTQDPWAVGCGAGGVWVTSGGVGLRRIDPTTNTIVATAPLPIHFYSVAVGGGYAWTTDETSGTLYKVDPTGTVVANYVTGDGARQLAFAGGRVWVTNADVGTVTGIDASTGAERTFRFGHPVLFVSALGDSIVVGVDEGLTYEDRIDALEGEVARILVPLYVFDPPDPALAWNPWLFEINQATCATLMTRADALGSGAPLRPELAVGDPRISADRRTYTFTLRSGVRFAPQSRPGSAVRPGDSLPASSSPAVTAEAVRFSVERALSPTLGAQAFGSRHLGDLVGVDAYRDGAARHISGIRVRGNTISFTLTRPSRDFLERLSLPFFCTVPIGTPLVQGGVQPTSPPSAGPYYMSDRYNGEYMILARNPNYTGPRPARLDAIAFREGLAPETAVGRVQSGEWDALIYPDALLEPRGIVARNAGEHGLRHEVLPVGGPVFGGASSPLFALVSTRLACDEEAGDLDFATLCLAEE